VRRHRQAGEYELRLHKLIQIVQTRDVGRSIADDQIRVFPIEMRQDLAHFVHRRDIALYRRHALDRRHRLQVDGDNLRQLFLLDPSRQRG
jgi:hypothetical protein